MSTLFVLYDDACELCRRCRGWLGRQPAFVRLAFIPLRSPEVGTRFPGIEEFHPEERLLVISEEGDVWRGEDAWLMCLWALREYREWSVRLAQPALKPFARRVCELVSENRYGISRWFLREPAEETQRFLAALGGESPASRGYCKPR